MAFAAIGGYLVTAFLLGLGSKALGDATQKKPKKPKDPKTAHNVNTRSSREPLKVCYGEIRTGVNKTFWHTVNPYLYIVCEIGEGPIAGIVRQDGTTYGTTGAELPSENPPLVYLDDILWTDYNDLVYIEYFSGTHAQAVCSTLETATAGTATEWDQTLRYTAYLMIRLKYDRDQFNGEPEVTVKIQGVEIDNPVTDTTAYSRNAALCAYDFMTRSSERGGLGINSNRIDTDALSDSIDYCDAKNWTSNMPIHEDVAAIDNLNQILMNFRGDVIQSGDKFKIVYRDLNYESVAMALDEGDVIRRDNIHSSLTIEQPYAGSRPNAIRATHYSEEKNFKQDDIITPDTTAIASDGDLREEQIELYGLSDPQYVQMMSNYYLERYRLNRTASFVATNRAFGLEPMDIITLTHSMPGWTAQKLRVLGSSINGDYTVSLNTIEEADTLYDDTYNLTAHDYDITTLPRPTDAVAPVVGASMVEEVYYFRNRSFTRLKIDFDAPAAADYPFWDGADVWLKIGSGEWRYMTRCYTNYQIDPVEEGETYYVKLQSVSIFGKREDFDKCTYLSGTVVGVTVNPSSLTAIMAIANGDSVTIYGTPLTDPDIEGYEIRLGTTWAGGIFISFNKNISLRLNGVRPGTHTFWAAAKDNSGHYSSTPVSATVTVFIPPGYSSVDTDLWDYSTGTFDNTEQVTYDSTDSLKCSHTSDVLVGTWTSPTWDLTSSQKVRVWGDFLFGFVSSATTWDGVYPLATTGSDLLTDGAMSNWTTDDLDDWTESNCDASEEVSGETGSAAEITTSAAGGYIYETITVTAENWYVLRGYYKNTSGDIATYEVYDSDNSISLSNGAVELGSNTSFTAFSFLFDTPAGCTSVQIRLGGVNNGDIIWFDTVSVYEIDDANSTTWYDNDPDGTMSWAELFSPETASSLQATLRHKVLIGDSWSEIDYFEILCAEVEARYLSVVVTITDPSLDANLYLKELNMSAYSGPA